MAEEAAPAAEPKAAPVEAAKPAGAPAGAEAKAAPTEAEVKAGDGAIDPNKSYTQADLDRIVAKVKKNERYRTKKEVEAFYQGRESAAAPKPDPAPVKAAVEDKPPTREAFDSYEAFLDAKAEYTGRKAAADYRAKAEAEAKEEQARTAHAERTKSFQDKVNAKYPDLAERIADIGEIAMPPGMADAIAESDLGPDVLNHFADNPKDFERIAALSPSAAIREIGRLEARLEGAAQKPAPVAEVKNPSAAPKPISPLGGTATVSDPDDLSKLVDKPELWRAARDRQIAARRKAGQAK